MGTCGFYKALGPSALRLHTEATRAHRKVLRTCSVHYGKIIPPHYSHPHIVNSYYCFYKRKKKPEIPYFFLMAALI